MADIYKKQKWEIVNECLSEILFYTNERNKKL